MCYSFIKDLLISYYIPEDMVQHKTVRALGSWG